LINKKNAFVISLLNAFVILICGLKFRSYAYYPKRCQ